MDGTGIFLASLPEPAVGSLAHKALAKEQGPKEQLSVECGTWLLEILEIACGPSAEKILAVNYGNVVRSEVTAGVDV